MPTRNVISASLLYDEKHLVDQKSPGVNLNKGVVCHQIKEDRDSSLKQKLLSG
jgi:hypothetical protein